MCRRATSPPQEWRQGRPRARGGQHQPVAADAGPCHHCARRALRPRALQVGAVGAPGQRWAAALRRATNSALATNLGGAGHPRRTASRPHSQTPPTPPQGLQADAPASRLARRQDQNLHHRHDRAERAVLRGDGVDAGLRAPRQEHPQQAGGGSAGGGARRSAACRVYMVCTSAAPARPTSHPKVNTQDRTQSIKLPVNDLKLTRQPQPLGQPAHQQDHHDQGAHDRDRAPEAGPGRDAREERHLHQHRAVRARRGAGRWGGGIGSRWRGPRAEVHRHRLHAAFQRALRPGPQPLLQNPFRCHSRPARTLFDPPPTPPHPPTRVLAGMSSTSWSARSCER
jgi:hypothetical protein